MKKNDILKKYIIDKYGSIAKFSKKEKFSPQNLEIIFHKKDIFHEIGIAVRVCEVLNIDAEKLFCQNEIAELKKEAAETTETPYISLDETIKEKYARLSAEEQEKALSFAKRILESGN